MWKEKKSKKGAMIWTIRQVRYLTAAVNKEKREVHACSFLFLIDNYLKTRNAKRRNIPEEDKKGNMENPLMEMALKEA